MKKRQFVSLLLVVMILSSLFASVNAAEVDSIQSYNGDYFLAINTNQDYTSSQYSGDFSVDSMQSTGGLLSDNDLQSDVSIVDVNEDDGVPIYQIDINDKLKEFNKSSLDANVQKDTVYLQEVYNVGDQKEFITLNYKLMQTENKYFTLKYSGEKCNIWVENNNLVNITTDDINSMANEFENKIQANMEIDFGQAFDVDSDGKTALLLYDIQDGFNIDTYRYYTAGLFWPIDFYEGYGNNMDALHIDTYPAMGTDKANPDVSKVYSTIAHENQHLINFSYSYENELDEMPVWLNEGLSMAAQNMLYGVLTSRINAYNSSTYIRDGQSLFDWENGDTMSRYAMSYLFVQYLRCQTKDFENGGTEIYKDIIESCNKTNTVVEDIMRQFYPSITFDDILMNYRMATILKEPEGPQGFMGESDFNSVKPLLYTGSGLDIKGGGAVIKAISSPVTPASYGAGMKFAGFSLSKVASPVASIPSGNINKGNQIYLSCETSGAEIRYTIDGSTPTATTGAVYTTPIAILSDTTIKAIACKSGYKDSDIVTLSYNVLPAIVSWKNNFGGTGNDYNRSITAVKDGYITVGHSLSDSFGSGDSLDLQSKGLTDAIVLKYDVDGNLAWKRNFGGIDNDYLNSVTAVNDGVITVGYSQSNSFGTGDFIDIQGKGSDDATIAKYDINGNLLWNKNFGGLGNDCLNFVSYVDDGYVVVGYSDSNSFENGDWINATGKGNRDAIIIKYDANGNLLWNKNFGGLDNDEFNSVCEVDDGYIAVGYSGSFGNGDWENTDGKGISDAIIVKYDKSGNIMWKKNFGGLDDDNFYSLISENDELIAVGYSGLSSWENGDWEGIAGKGKIDAIIVKFDKNGDVIWKKNFGGSDDDCFTSLILSNNGYIAVGNSFIEDIPYGDWSGISGNGSQDSTIVKYDKSGNVTWKKNFGSLYSDSFSSITTSINGCVAVGHSDLSSNSGDWIDLEGKGLNDGIIVKFNDEDTLPIESLYRISYGLYNDTQKLNIMPQEGGIYKFKAQYANTTGKGMDVSLLLTVNCGNKLLKTYIAPVTVSADGVIDFSNDIELPLSKSIEIKLIAIEGFENLKPLANLLLIK